MGGRLAAWACVACLLLPGAVLADDVQGPEEVVIPPPEKEEVYLEIERPHDGWVELGISFASSLPAK